MLTDENLVEIAKTKRAGPSVWRLRHASRISETVTDVLVERGNANVARKVVANDGARLSELRLREGGARSAGAIEALAAALASRSDVPAELQPFLKMVLA